VVSRNQIRYVLVQLCMKKPGIPIVLCLFAFWLSSIFADGAQQRRVEQNVLISDALPALRIQIDPQLHYAGSFPFQIEDIAAGDRYVFVDAKDKAAKRIFIAQFEGFLPQSNEIYRYKFDHSAVMGGHQFRSNPFAFSFAQAEKNEPGKEADLTTKFLRTKGYQFSDQWMVYRFLTLGDDSRRQEMILFYMEPIEPTGYKLNDFYQGEEPTAIWNRISESLKERALKSFKIL
jgi:hypothetical protein